MVESMTSTKRNVARAIIEAGFIIFLFYSNLLMGEFSKSGRGTRNGLAWAVRDIFTLDNFIIGIVASLVGYVLVEILRNRMWNRRNSK
jgi:hypothetical protein